MRSARASQMPETARLPLPIYDRLVEIANREETSVSMLVRQLLILRLK